MLGLMQATSGKGGLILGVLHDEIKEETSRIKEYVRGRIIKEHDAQKIFI